MDCRETRHVLNLGMLPGTADPIRTMLGFHLSRCSSCRTYRTHLYNQHLLYSLLSQELPHGDVPATLARASITHRATATLRAASAAVIVGSLLALNPLATATPARAAATIAAPCEAPQVANPPSKASRNVYRVSLGNVARVTDSSVDAAVGPASAVGVVHEELSPIDGIEGIELQAGTELLIPALNEAPETIAPAPLDQSGSLGVYVVQWGDTLSAVAQRYYGNANLWYVIYNANQGIIGGNPSWIYEGQRLTIPAVGNQPAPPQTGQGPGYYTVRSGDTLSSIALNAYGNANLWSAIYNANRGLIGANPGLIYPGQGLSIPSSATAQVPPNPQNASYSGPTGYYQVLGGDSLSAIAQKVYGNANLWYVVYNANVNVIGANPNLIYPGQQLTIPGIS